MNDLHRVEKVLSRIQAKCINTTFAFIVAYDQKFTLTGSGNYRSGRVFIQAVYRAPCTKTGIPGKWKGRKWYLSSHMTDDEIVKTAYCAFKAAVEHEVMEGFKIDGKILFNPHINFEELLAVSDKEIKRAEMIE